VSRSERRTDRDLEASFGPEAGDLFGVHLGSAGLGIVEVAPREHVDSA
jgi:hypothetical protein